MTPALLKIQVNIFNVRRCKVAEADKIFELSAAMLRLGSSQKSGHNAANGKPIKMK